MTDRSMLRAIEKRAWLRTFEHGMWDVGIGSIFLLFGLSIITEFPALAAIWVASFYPALRQTGRKLVVPRVGQAQFRGRRKRAMANTTWILTGVAVMGLGTFLFMFWQSSAAETPAWVEWITQHFVIFIGLIWGGALAVSAWILHFPRLYAYGALMFGSLLVTDLIEGYHLGISLTIVGGIILVTGLLLLLRFIRKYPKQDLTESENHGQAT